METNNLKQKIWDELNENQDSYAFYYSEIEDEVNCAIDVTLRKQREDIVKDFINLINKEFKSQQKTTWNKGEEHSSNPIHQSDFIAWHKEIIDKISKLKSEEVKQEAMQSEARHSSQA